MKNIFFFLLLFTGIVNGQIVNIPDANFKAKLLAADTNNAIASDLSTYPNAIQHSKIDINNDGEIQISEALTITYLDVSNSNISTIQGIEEFTNLKWLNCDTNNLTTINILALTQLLSFNCNNNNLEILNVNSLVNLEVLWCANNNLLNLNLNGLYNLSNLWCGYNPISNLNLAGLNNITYLQCHNNLLTELDISNLINLKMLYCNSNLLTSLDVSHNNNLLTFFCGDNQLTTLDVSNLNLLTDFHCGINQIASIDVTNCVNLALFGLGDNFIREVYMKNGRDNSFYFFTSPNLQFICADDIELNAVQIQLNTYAPQAVVNSYCFFTPGGNYNTIIGSMPFDFNNDGCDEADIANPYLKVNINDGSTTGSTFTNSNGNYTFYTQAGNFTLTPEVENSSYFNFSPANAVLNFPVVDNSTQTQHFCVTANGVHPDLEVTFVPLNNARPGFDAHYKIVYKNKGTQTLSGNIKLSYDSSKLDFISTFPDDNFQTNPNEISWNYNTLQPFETRDITLTLNVLTPPTVNDGDILNFTTTINPIAADETPLDNVFVLNQTVVNSYDPNQIECLEGNIITPEEVGNYLHYNINFENVGTADAINIVVKDTINTAKFNLNSLQLQYASHEVETKVTGNIVEFIFKNIHLQPSNGGPIGGHGNVLFKIKTLPNLVVGDEVMGSANIFFDYNAPIATNEERTVIATLSKPDFIRDESITIAPNPAKNDVNIQSKSNIKSILFFDAQGRLLQTVLVNKNSITLDISNYASGVYFLKVITEKGSSVEKIMKEH